MIKIGIVDDEKYIIDVLKAGIENCLQEMNKTCDIYTFLSGEDALKYIEQIDIIFLDIEMPEMDGIETGKRIKEKNPNCTIIMATGNVERFKEAFQINAFRYITKPFEEEEIKEALQTCFAQMIGRNVIEVFNNRISHKIAEKDICYIRAYNGYTLIVANGNEYRSELSLKDYEKMLDAQLFMKANRSYLVNVLHLEQNLEGEIVVHGEKIKISRRQKAELREKFVKADVGLR